VAHMHTYSGLSSLTLGAHAHRGLPYLICVCVCVPVSTYSHPTGTKPAHQRYQRF